MHFHKHLQPISMSWLPIAIFVECKAYMSCMLLIDWTIFSESHLLVQMTCFDFTPTISIATPAYLRANCNGPDADVPGMPCVTPSTTTLAEMLLRSRMSGRRAYSRVSVLSFGSVLTLTNIAILEITYTRVHFPRRVTRLWHAWRTHSQEVQ